MAMIALEPGNGLESVSSLYFFGLGLGPTRLVPNYTILIFLYFD